MEKEKSSKAMHISLWVAQVLLAVMFIMSGFMKLSMPIEKLSAMVPWTGGVPLPLVRFIGITDLLGGIGLLLPSLLRIKPTLTVWAALGLVTTMSLAIPFHISRGESSVIGMNIVLLLIAAFIAWGRSKKAPIQAR